MNRLRNIVRYLWDRIQCRFNTDWQVFGRGASWAVCLSKLPHHPRIISGGVGNDVSFEYAMVHELGAQVVMFDPSPTGMETIRSLGALPLGMRFFEKGLAGKSGSVGFVRPQNENEGSWRCVPGSEDLSFECLDYKDSLSLAGWDSCDLVKIDIEGFEYAFLKSLPENGPWPKQIAVEMHGFLPGHSWRDSFRLRRYLGGFGYSLVWKRREDHLFVRL